MVLSIVDSEENIGTVRSTVLGKGGKGKTSENFGGVGINVDFDELGNCEGDT
jgi:hypothetical protein